MRDVIGRDRVVARALEDSPAARNGRWRRESRSALGQSPKGGERDVGATLVVAPHAGCPYSWWRAWSSEVMPSRTANFVSSATLCSSSLIMMLLRWVSTVFRLM